MRIFLIRGNINT